MESARQHDAGPGTGGKDLDPAGAAPATGRVVPPGAGDAPENDDPHDAGTTSGSARQRKQVLLRLDPAVHQALQAWAASELRSVNAQIELLLRQALRDADRLPREVRPVPRRGRPPAGRDDAT